MKPGHLRNGLLGLAAIFVLSFLAARAQAVDVDQHARYQAAALRLKELDAKLDEELLRTRYELLASYDPLVSLLTELKATQASLATPPTFVGAEGRADLARLLDRHAESIAQHERLIERYKSQNAILRNSVQYAPALFEELKASGVRQTGDLFRDVLLYNLTSDPELVPTIRAQLDALVDGEKAVSNRSSGDEASLTTLRSHVDAILRTKPVVDQLVDEILAVPDIALVDDLLTTYGREYQTAVLGANIYRLLLFGAALLLLGLTVYVLVCLRRATVALNAANEDLVHKNAALRASEAQKAAVLEQMGDAVLVADRQGHLILANGAAVRFSGGPLEHILGMQSDVQAWQSFDRDGRPHAAKEQPLCRAVRGEATSGEYRLVAPTGVQSWIWIAATPLRDKDGQPQGAVLVARDITEAKLAQAAIEHQAWHDLLTGLPNRVRLGVELDRLIAAAQHDPEPFALLLLDLDRFKEVNDTLGPQRGDLLLQQIGPRFRAELRETDTLARLGGDEFAVVLPGLDAEAACALAARLQRALEQPVELDGARVEVAGSIGVALYPDHGADADTLLRRADVAMYAAKSARSGCVVYREDHDRHSPARLALVAELRRAIDGDQLELHYQPQVDVLSGRLASVEALVRWRHPERGLMPPEEFIPVAEQTRLIQPLSRWVLRAALRQCAAWRDAGMDVPVTVNLSAHDLQDPTLPELVAELLSASRAAADHLHLEITESALLADPPRAHELLARLRALGVRIAIDDFGTGYSSLAYLQRLPVDVLKIDRSFVRDMAADEGARAIVRAIIDLADDLGLGVVAEGVEDRATWDVLAALGCQVAQGYYLCQPVPAAALEGWLDGIAHWRFEEAERHRAEAALAERVRDRGARLAAEDEFIARKRAEWALRQGEERLRLAIEAAEMVTWDWDLVENTITWSGGTQALFGLEPAAVGRNRDALLERVHPDDRPRVEMEVEQTVQEGGELRVEHRIVRPDGSIGWVASRGRVFRDPAGRPVRLLGTDVDVTERKEAERRRETLLQAEKLRALGQLASGVAHDLNQSLLLIAGYGDLARQMLDQLPQDVPGLRETLDVVARAALDGGETVKRLLTFGRGQSEGQAQRVDVGTLLGEVAQLTAPQWRDTAQASGRPISLQVDSAGDTTVLGWPADLREALTNLVFNAVDALPSGGTIRLSASHHADQVTLEVADSGVGMSPEVQARIFEPFYTTKGARGTGLGLAQVFGIVERHHGRIEVESAPGRGTTFRLTLSAAAVHPTRPQPAQTSMPESAHALRILAVDDEPLITRMVTRILRPDGHVVLTATSGEEALERLRREPVDLIISDVAMGPGINGWELAEQVRDLLPHVAFVLATGFGAQIDQAEARAKGIGAVIAKPYRPEDLRRLLAQLAPATEQREAA